ncbi:T9SS type A sorting domain-containing protein [Polaribacter sp. Asnod1-A03]|uniref:T9SS type A sorting domain-containing protein n=1 Tax=Polaribacter sp. Asnod1-A03 TaxID=3160581 RepID=UPI00386B3B86
MKKLLLFILFPFYLFGQTQIGQDIDGESAGDFSGHSISLSSDGNILAIGAIDNDGNGISSGHVRIFRNNNNVWEQIGSDIDGEGSYNQFGVSVSLSSDGNTLAVGAPLNSLTGGGFESGHVRIYRNNNDVWEQIGDDIDGPESSYSGNSVSLSSDGSIVAIGIQNYSDNTNFLPKVGQVRIYRNNNNTWEQIGNNINGQTAYDYFGEVVSLSSNGNIIAIGASNNDTNGLSSGQVRIYKNIDNYWTQVGNEINGDNIGASFGSFISLSSDGNILAIGGSMVTENGDFTGKVKVYKNIDNNWVQLGNEFIGSPANRLGSSVELNSDGSIIAISLEYANFFKGLVKIYKFIDNNWIQLGNDIIGESESDQFGSSLSLSFNGNIIAIGAIYNAENGTDSGHVRVYDLSVVLSTEESNVFNFSMYPNPSKNKFNIELSSELIIKKIEVFNSIGLLVKTAQKKEITTSSFATGIYFVRITTNKGKAIEKLIIE